MSDAGGETAVADIDLSQLAAEIEKLKSPNGVQLFPESPVPQQFVDAANRVVEESTLKDNIVSYKAANTAWIDTLMQLKHAGLLNAFGAQVAPFPQKPGTNIVIVGGDNSQKPQEEKPQEPVKKPEVQPSAPDPLKDEAKKELEQDDKRFGWLKKAALAAALLGGGAATPWVGSAIIDKIKGDEPVIQQPVNSMDPTVETEVH